MRTQIVTEQILGEVFYSVTIQGEADVTWLYLQLYACNLRWCHVVTSYWGECNSRMVRSEHIPRATPLHVHMVCNCFKIDLNRIRNIKVLPRGPFPPALAFNASKAFCSSFCFCLKATSSCRGKQTQTVQTLTKLFPWHHFCLMCVTSLGPKMFKLPSCVTQSQNLKRHIALEKLFKCVIMYDKQGIQVASKDITIEIISYINW